MAFSGQIINLKQRLDNFSKIRILVSYHWHLPKQVLPVAAIGRLADDPPQTTSEFIKPVLGVVTNFSFALGNVSLFLHYYKPAKKIQSYFNKTKAHKIASMPDLIFLPAYFGAAYLASASFGPIAGAAAAVPIVPACAMAIRNSLRNDESKLDHLPNTQVNDLFACSALVSGAFAVLGGNPLGIAAQSFFMAGNVCKSILVRNIRHEHEQVSRSK